MRLTNLYASDVPCLPSRTAMWSGRFGLRTGVVNHGGLASVPFEEVTRGHEDTFRRSSWMSLVRRAGLKTATVSPFAERHSAWHWYAGFNEVYNTGKHGMETADEISAVALKWLQNNGEQDDWFLHVNLWDPHTPYRTPESYGDPFNDDPLPAWLTDEVRAAHWRGGGPHSAREVLGFNDTGSKYPRQPSRIADLDDVRRVFDGYDAGVRYADDYLGRILNALADLNVLDDTAVIVSADHGENLGELNVYGDHQTADEYTAHVPLILRWPGLEPRVYSGFHYQLDLATTVLDLLGEGVPDGWDGVSFAPALREGTESGRDFLVLSQGAWSCQRAVRWGDLLCIRTYHDGFHDFPEVMLFNLRDDPHEQRDLAPENPALVAEGLALLEHWTGATRQRSPSDKDPLWTVIREGGPFYTRRQLPFYLKRLRGTDRGEVAARLEAKHPLEADRDEKRA